jgi:limonene-1,2-epoxide hydrolase
MKRRTFLSAAGVSGVAAVGAMSAAMSEVATAATAAEWNAAERANVNVVTDFCVAWSTRDMNKTLPFLADDCVYRVTETTPPVNGHDGVTQRLKTLVDTASLVEFRILDTMAAGPIVINHRIDRFMTAQPLIWEGVGVFFVKDGKIKEWSDYTIRFQR